MRAPYIVLGIGRIIKTDDNGNYIIMWHDEKTELVSKDNVPKNFTSFEQDKWFIARIERNRETEQLEKIISAEYTTRSPIYSKEEREAFWNQR